METMTLETLRIHLADMEPEDAAVINAALDAAIHERDELRHNTDILNHEGIVEIASRNSAVQEYCAHWEHRAEKAEAELAALKKRIAEARMETVNKAGPYWGEGASFGIVMALVDAKLIGRPVRLLVEDDV